MMNAVSAWLASLRQPARAARVARWLWIAFAFVVWNVIFDRILVLAGRQYVHAATVAARGSGPYLRVDDWMRSAMTRGLWDATAAAAVILAIGLICVSLAARGRPPAPPGDGRPTTRSIPCLPSCTR
jgi:hypothetical protein